MKHVRRLVGTLALAVVQAAQAQGEAQVKGDARLPVDDLRLLMVAAIDSRDGTARGILTGKDADGITQYFKATSPILVDITTVKRYAEAGCSRLRVAFSQEGVKLTADASPRRQGVAFGINYCRHGKPPKSLS